MSQATIQQDFTVGVPGMIASTRSKDTISRKAAIAIAFGLLCMADYADAAGLTQPPVDNSAANPTAILASGGASVALGQTVSGAALNGVVGRGTMRPSRLVTIAFSNNANWSLGVGRLYGINEAGVMASEPVHVRASGNYTWQSRNRYRRVIKLELPVAGGTAGTFTIGYAANVAPAFLVDDDAIMTSVATAASAQVFTGADFNGVLGQLYTYPAKQVILTENVHTDWNATTVRIEGEDEQGNPQTENMTSIADTGGIVTSVKKFSRVTRIDLPAQTGTSGTLLVGYAADAGGAIQWGSINYDDVGVSVFDDTREQAASPAGYQQYDMACLIVEGECYASAETAVVEGADVFVRIVAAGPEVRGQLRMDDDAGDAVRVVGWRFGKTTTVAGPAKVRLTKAA